MVLEYVKTLVWPAVLVFSTITFKTQIAALFGRLRALRGGVAEVEFSDEAASVRVETEIAAAEQQVPVDDQLAGSENTVTLSLQQVLDQLLLINPNAAVMKGWDMIRDRLIVLAVRAYPREDMALLAAARGWIDALRLLEKRGLPSATARSIGRLGELRNRVAHAGWAEPLGSAAGRDYVDAAVNVWEALNAFEHRLREEPVR